MHWKMMRDLYRCAGHMYMIAACMWLSSKHRAFVHQECCYDIVMTIASSATYMFPGKHNTAIRALRR